MNAPAILRMKFILYRWPSEGAHPVEPPAPEVPGVSPAS